MAKTYPAGTRFAGIGFSLGGGILARYVGEKGTDCPLIAGVAVSACMDFGMFKRLRDDVAAGRVTFTYVEEMNGEEMEECGWHLCVSLVRMRVCCRWW